MGLSIYYPICVLLVLTVRPYVRAADQCSDNTLLTVNPDADVKFTAIMTVHPSIDDNTCGDLVADDAVQNIGVLQWTVDKINNGGYFAGNITLGFDVIDDCGIARQAIAGALDVFDGSVLGTNTCLHGNGSVCNIGIIGPSNSLTTAAVLYALDGTTLPVLNPYATQTSLSTYSNLFRTVPTDDVYIQAITDVLKSLGLTYVALVHEDNARDRYIAKMLKTNSKEVGVCIDVMQTIKDGDINVTSLVEQRDKTKDRSLRVVYLGTMEMARKMLRQLRFTAPTPNNITWLFVEQIEDQSEALVNTVDFKIPNGTLIISQSDLSIPELQEFVSKKWARVIADGRNISDELETLMATVGKTKVPKWTNKNVAASIDAAFVFASALQRKQKFHCLFNSGICDDLKKDFKFEIKEVTSHPINYTEISQTFDVAIPEIIETNRMVDFQSNGERLVDPSAVLYSVYYTLNSDLNRKKIAEYRNSTVYQTNESQQILGGLATSLCKDSCPACVDVPEIPFAYIDGESLILGVFSVHETDPDNPFKCAKLRTSQMDVVIIESFLHTIQTMREETGIDFGAIALDDCYSAARTELVLSQILAKDVLLYKPGTTEVIDVDKILIVISSSGSTVTIPMTALMTHLRIPTITSSASSPDLDDRVNFPYFLRTVPSDIEQVRAMISIIKRLEWKFVSLLYVENNYGSKGKEALLNLAAENDICVAEVSEGLTPVADNTTGSELINAFTNLVNHNSDIVVYFGTEARISNFLEIVYNAKRTYKFIFLSSEDWGDRKYILEKGGSGTKGSITLKNEVFGLYDDPFADFIRQAKPDPSLRNPWFTEYWEETFQCDLHQSFSNKYNHICDPDQRFPEEMVQEFLQDQRIVHTVDSVKAAMKGLIKSKEKYCNQKGDNFPCPKYFQYIPDVVTQIREVTIERGQRSVRVFKDDGNGNVGFKIKNIQEQDVTKELYYRTVGSFDEGILDLNTDNLKFYRSDLDGECSGNGCDHCFNKSMVTSTPLPTTTHVHGEAQAFGVPDYTIIGILGALFITMIILFLIVVCYFKKRITELEKELKKTTFEMRTGYTPSTLQNGSAFSNIQTTSLNHYPDLQFANTGPSGNSMYEWNKAQSHLKDKDRVGNGVVNKGFVGSEMYIHARHNEDENRNNPNSTSANLSNGGKSSSSGSRVSNDRNGDSPVYKPSSSTSYGISSHSSFKRPADSQVKKQPRTQLAVPPCRPELPPRDQPPLRAHGSRPHVFPENFDHLLAHSAVPKEKIRKVRSSPRRTAPPSLKHSPSTGESSRYNKDHHSPLESPRYKDMAFSNGALQSNNSDINSTNMVNMGGSIEKISRV